MSDWFRFGNIWQILPNSKLLYPPSAGLGFALSYTPALAMVGRYFNERKALAYGIALSGIEIFTHLIFFRCHSYFTFPFLSFSAKSFHPLKPNFTSSSGSGIGTFILAPAVQLLIENYSWRGALLILGGFVSNLCVCGALMRPLEPRRKERWVL